MARPPVIAVVNDDPVFIRLMDTLLTVSGFSVVAYPPSGAAPDVIAAAQPAAVLLDTWMQLEGDGWQLAETLRRDPRTGSIPVLVCSSNPQEVRARAPEVDGVDGIEMLAKPFDPDDLVAKVNEILRRKRSG